MSTSSQPAAGDRTVVNSDDPRAVRTREKLVDAFARIAGSGPVTVAALTEAAGVHRSVFYKHFESPDDLAVYMLRDLFAALSDADGVMRGRFAVDGLEASRSAMTELVRFLGARRSVYAPLLGPHAPAGAGRQIAAAFEDLTAAAITRMTTRPAEVDTVVLARFLARGVLGVIERWLDDAQPRMSQAQVIGQLVLCFPAWLTAGTNETPSKEGR